MTDNPNVDPAQGTGADGDQPEVSPNAGKSIDGKAQLPQEFLELGKRLDLVTRELKGLQSRQDKERNEVQRFMDDLKANVARGMSLEEAERAVTESRKASEKDDLLFKIAAKVGVLDPPSAQPAGNGASATAEVNKIIEELNLDVRDADVNRLIREYGDNPVAFAMRAGSHAATLTSRPAPSPSVAPAMTGGPAHEKSVEALTSDYRKDMLAAPRGNRKALLEIKEKYRSLGVPVDNVIFE